jgi:hypothetical protein
MNKEAVRSLLSEVEGLAAEVASADEAHRLALAEISAKRSALVGQMAEALDGATKFAHPTTGRTITVVERDDSGTKTYFLRGLNPAKAPKKSNVISLDA